MEKKTIKHIINALRNASISWHERTNCLKRGRKKMGTGVFNGFGLEKKLWAHSCDSCEKWFFMKDNLLEVDHIDPVGPFKNDWNDFIPRMYCHPDNLQKLCRPCHLTKTTYGNAQLRYKRKEFRAEDYL